MCKARAKPLTDPGIILEGAGGNMWDSQNKTLPSCRQDTFHTPDGVFARFQGNAADRLDGSVMDSVVVVRGISADAVSFQFSDYGIALITQPTELSGFLVEVRFEVLFNEGGDTELLFAFRAGGVMGR
jgi:hypothetical protein